MSDASLMNSKPHGLNIWEGSSAFVNQGRHWSSALIWITAALLGSTVLWAFVSRIDQTIVFVADCSLLEVLGK